MPLPEDMLELIGRWDYGLKYRLFEMVNHVVNNDLLTGDGRADYVYDVSELRSARRSCTRARSSTRLSISTAT